MDERGALAVLIGRAHQRHVFQHVGEQLALSAAIILACVIVLLLLGTDLVNPYWLLAVFAISLAANSYRSRGKMLSAYQLAQALDRRLNLNDSLSTAVFFQSRSGDTGGPRLMIESQRALAEHQASSVDVRTGLPFHAPRALYLTLCLAGVTLSMLALRYGVTRSLDLRASLVHMPFSGSIDSPEVASARKKTGEKPVGDRAKEKSVSYDPWESKVIDQQGAPDSALNTIETPDVNNSTAEASANAKANGTPSKDPAREPGEPAEGGERSPAANDQPGDNTSAPDKDADGSSGKQSSSQQDQQGSNSSGENSSLSDKMRDALSNLMSKLKMNQKAGEGKQGAAQSQNGAQSAQQKQGKDDKGSPTPGKPQSDGMSSPDAQGDQEGQSSDKAQSSQNKSSKGSEKPQSQDGKSGIGKQDGDKSAREAEQLAAMGKVSEIIGKRSAGMTGEVMVEVASGKQQLKTQYSQKRAAHSEAGGEINRDEVPLEYQQYVQQYFEEIRKMPPAAAKARKPNGS